MSILSIVFLVFAALFVGLGIQRLIDSSDYITPILYFVIAVLLGVSAFLL